MLHSTANSILNYAQTANHVAVNPLDVQVDPNQSAAQRLSELHATKCSDGHYHLVPYLPLRR